jgi:predicted chitinase
MIISPPFLPASGLTASDASKPDPMMDLIDQFEIGHHGAWPVTFDRRSHCAIHLNPGEQTEPVRAIADGDVVAYRVCKNAISDGTTDSTTGQPVLNSNAGFVLLRHKTDTGDGRTITFYSLYMHLLDMTSQEHIVPQPNDPPETGSANALPKWLLDTAGGKDGVVQSGGTKKVYRKDMLGYVGQHQGVAHLHFEIFMADGDFTAWFDKVQIGVKIPAQPTTGDYWGHSYFVISGPKEFYPQPAGGDETWFPRVPGGSLGAGDTLYVEAWFNKGQRFTRAWIDKGGSGSVTLLTPAPIADPYDNAQKHYEYDLYERAMALYPACPSDGYEMLRFGRILSDHPTLTGAACATWIAVPLDENGTLGYVNIAPDAIKKPSDADFPFFTGWQKVDSDNTPFNDAGRCDYATLCGLTGIQDSLPSAQPLEADPNNNNEVNLQLASYVQNTDGVDEKLRGMVFKARSEWDPSNNEERYKDLNDPYGFFGKQKDTNPDGYTKFTDFLSKFQFLDKTPLAGQQLWFFHPLAFIRHFRKCGWFAAEEIAQCVPRSVLSLHGTQFVATTRAWNDALAQGNAWKSELNLALRKYRISSTKERATHFLAQLMEESGWLKAVREYHGEDKSYSPYYGRGLIQLTHMPNYSKYGEFRKFPVDPSVPAKFSSIKWNPDVLMADTNTMFNRHNCADSAALYWTCRKMTATGTNTIKTTDAGGLQIDTAVQASKSTNGNVPNQNVNGLDHRLQSFVYIKYILLDLIEGGASEQLSFVWRRNSATEPLLDANGQPVLDPVTHHPKKRYIPTTHTIQVSLEKQRP